jgi:hypothetical protein
MNNTALRSVLFGAGFWFGGVVAAAIDIYVFDHFETKWSRGWNLQVTMYGMILLALAAATLFALGRVWLGKRFALRSARLHGRVVVVATGIAFSMVFVTFGNLLTRSIDTESMLHPLALWSFFILGSLASGGALPSREQAGNSAVGASE